MSEQATGAHDEPTQPAATTEQAGSGKSDPGVLAQRLRYLFERRPGRSNALNTGIAACEGDLVGMIDDDEEIDRSWFRAIRAAFERPGLDFIGGP